MKGLIFTEFLEMVEEKWDLKMVDTIIRDSGDPIEGAYSSTQFYDHKNLVQLVVALHEKTGIPLPDLLKTYGLYLFPKLAESHRYIMPDVKSALDLLENIEELIHVTVKKLYPQANPPMFEGERLDDTTLRLIYHSHRSMGDVAEGLIEGCGKHYMENLRIERLDSIEDGTKVEFIITKVE